MAKGTPSPDRLKIGDDLWVMNVEIASLREQDINAQVMQPRHFERLTENIRNRGALESMPYCHQPRGEGPVEVISGHHRCRATRAAGLSHVWAIVDTRVMRRSEIIAKQIAHNELHGETDRDILAHLVAMIDNVDDLLATGLPEDALPTVNPDDTKLSIPHGEFDWRVATLMFLPHQMEEFKDAVKVIDNATDLIGVASADQFEEFSAAVYEFGRCRDIRNFTTMVALLTDLARREVELARLESEESADSDTGSEPVPAG
ncbi:ParB N-terminal domain-containing protein [Streptosporangium sp. NPDC023963]|uniref:ParB N-terminal domain-containing protein n=1 Tax=Streptosporangium sp. NPDC023963 TaxID=3155608 RepID=UPI003436110C